MGLGDVVPKGAEGQTVSSHVVPGAKIGTVGNVKNILIGGVAANDQCFRSISYGGDQRIIKDRD